LSFTDIISNPLFVTVSGGLVTAVVSVYLSGRIGERAAVNYSLKQGRRRDHHTALLDEPAGQLIKEVRDTRQAFLLGIDYFAKPVSLNANKLLEVEVGQKRERTETDFLILPTGPQPAQDGPQVQRSIFRGL
jgi:phosphoribosylformylglycinamidine (FGAM) synthase-like enzyme